MTAALWILTVASWATVVFALPVCAYLGGLALLAGRPKARPAPEVLPRFDFVVPAHNESVGIASTVESLREVDYPEDRFRVVVIADNCDDDTAALARASGAVAFERFHDELRGKGYAMEWVFEQLLAEDAPADAYVVVDADTLVSKNILKAFAARIDAGERAAQAHYGVRNPDASWRTRLMTVALAMIHQVRSLGRERLGLSAGLRGNGMCFTRAVLEQVPHKAYGLVEDVEYGLALGAVGIRIAYVGEADALGEMVSTGGAAASQRKRWEGGRLKLAREKIPGLVKAALVGKGVRQRLMLLDLAADLAVPPLSYVGLAAVLGAGLELALFILTGTLDLYRGGVWLLAWLGLGLYVAGGVRFSGLGGRAIIALLWAPIYIVWKLAVARPWRVGDRWVRTQRETEEEGPEDE